MRAGLLSVEEMAQACLARIRERDPVVRGWSISTPTSFSATPGIHVCGGSGQHSRQTPDELRLLGERIGFNGAKLTRASRLVAKVDSATVQDGFDLYLHGFFVTDDGK